MNNVWNFIVAKYVYIIGLGMAIISLMDIKEAWENKRRLKLFFLIIVIGVTVAIPIWQVITYTTVKTEEVSIAKNNIHFLKGDTGNIKFTTTEAIEEPIDLRIKDTWIHLTYLTDYSVDNSKNVTINYEFGNNDTDNKTVANKGLMFTYKTRRNK